MLDRTLEDAIPAVLALLDVLPEDSPFQMLEPPPRRRQTLQALKRLVLRESQVQPLLLFRGPALDRPPRPRHSSTAWSRASRPPPSCSW